MRKYLLIICLILLLPLKSSAIRCCPFASTPGYGPGDEDAIAAAISADIILYSQIAPFTEAQLYGRLSDVSDFCRQNVKEAISVPWEMYSEDMKVHTSVPSPDDIKPMDEIVVDSVTYDPTGEGLSCKLRVRLARDTAELMPNQVDRDFSGASAWTDGAGGAAMGSYDETGDLTITANAVDDEVTIIAASIPTTSAGWFRLEFDAANLVDTWIVKDADKTNTIGTISANGTDQYLDFIADDSNGGLVIIAVASDSSGDFDNFSLNELPFVSVVDEAGNEYVNKIAAAMDGWTKAANYTTVAADINKIGVITAAADIQILADQCDTATFKWITLKQTGVFAVEAELLDAADDFYLSDGTKVEGSTNELALGGAAGDQVNLVCIKANEWWVMGEISVCIDAGAID